MIGALDGGCKARADDRGFTGTRYQKSLVFLTHYNPVKRARYETTHCINLYYEDDTRTSLEPAVTQ